MKITKQEILAEATKLFNSEGYSSISYRKLARVLGISHSNLIYHFKDKNALVEALHDQLLRTAVTINEEVKQESNSLRALLTSALVGFKALYDFRFFMLDFNYILRSNRNLQRTIIEVESLRYAMYDNLINNLLEEGIIRPAKYENEYSDFVKRIRVYSDYWISSAHVYEKEPSTQVAEYARIFVYSFYPYLTDTGVAKFDDLVPAYDWL